MTEKGYNLLTIIYSSFTVAPVIKVQNNSIGASLGTSVTLNCIIEAFPVPVYYWNKTKDSRISNG